MAKGPYEPKRPPGGSIDADDDERQRGRGPRIRCPRCEWEPDGNPYWQCERCLVSFDTFKTRAHCPNCPNHWYRTQCIACGAMSPHDDWYTEE